MAKKRNKPLKAASLKRSRPMGSTSFFLKSDKSALKNKTTLKKAKMGPAGVLILAGILLILAGNVLSWSASLGNVFQPLLAKEKEDSFYLRANNQSLVTQIKTIFARKKAEPVSRQGQTYFLPKIIFIPSLGLKAPIKIGGIVSGQWILRDDSVMVMSSSDQPWKDNNLILYAHKKKGLFLDLKKLAVGDKIVLEGLSGENLIYEVVSAEDAKPNEISKVQPDTANTLILFTCDGLFDQSRLIVKAKLISS